MKSGKSVFPKVSELPDDVVNRLQPDLRYTSKLAHDYDLSWQAVQGGYIGNAQTYTQFESVPVQDNYHFIRKQFHPAWVFYVLVIRLLTFHHPFKEIRGWWRTLNMRRQTTSIPFIVYPEWETYQSRLIIEQPLVSVIIPTLNRYDYLKDVLEDLEKQEYSNFEVIVVDQSHPFHPEFYKEFNLDIRCIRQEEKALWLARNTAVKEAKGRLIALSEDDVRLQPDWLMAHLKCLDFFDAQVSAGVFYPIGQDIPKERSFFATAAQFATGNALLYRSVFENVGLFDRQFEKQRMGDGEFGMRVYLAGIRSVSNPFASCVDVKADTGGLREMGSWDAFRPSSFFAPRPIPSVLYYFRKYYGNKAARWALWRNVPISVMPYRFKSNKFMKILGAFVSLLLMPLVIFQVLKSWHLATKKIKEGPIIEMLD